MTDLTQDYRLKRLGLKQEFKREFNAQATFGLRSKHPPPGQNTTAVRCCLRSEWAASLPLLAAGFLSLVLTVLAA